MFNNEKINDAYKNKNIRGFRLVIGEEGFSNILTDAMGLEQGSLVVTSAATHGRHRAIEVCALSDDERFPKIEEGQVYPHIIPIIKNVPVENEDGTTSYKVVFDGFNEVKP